MPRHHSVRRMGFKLAATLSLVVRSARCQMCDATDVLCTSKSKVRTDRLRSLLQYNRRVGWLQMNPDLLYDNDKSPDDLIAVKGDRSTRMPERKPVDTTEDHFDCDAGYANWELGWSNKKMAWCCEKEGKGCQFNCTAGHENWKRGWSSQKIAWCCKTVGKGCEALPWARNPSVSDEMDAESVARLAPPLPVSAQEASASKNSSIGNETMPASARKGPKVGANTAVTSENSSFGADGNGSNGSVNSTNRSVLRGGNASTCVTGDSSMLSSLMSAISPPGTPCIFGVDARDEGQHCIFEARGSSYGYFGWCYTSQDRSSFGSCDESCPLVGPDKILGKKIDDLKKALNESLRASSVSPDKKIQNDAVVPGATHMIIATASRLANLSTAAARNLSATLAANLSANTANISDG